MQIARTSRVIRWAYLFEKVPAQTSICPLFWRTVLLTPVFKLAAPLGFVLFLLSRFWFYPKPSFVITGVMAVFVAIVIGPLEWVERRRRRVQQQRWEGTYVEPSPSILREGFKAVKGTICPIVTIR